MCFCSFGEASRLPYSHIYSRITAWSRLPGPWHASTLLMAEAPPEKKQRPTRARQPPKQMYSGVDTKPPARALRTRTGLAITSQGSLWQYGRQFGGGRYSGGQFAEEVAEDDTKVEFRLYVGDVVHTVITYPTVEDWRGVTIDVCHGLGHTYDENRRVYEVPECQLIEGVPVAPSYREGLSADFLEMLRQAIEEGDPEMCVCLHRMFLSLLTEFDDDEALMAMYNRFCKIHGDLLRKNNSVVEITTALFNLRSPVGVGELVEDTAQGQFDALKALEGVAGMRLVACSLESIIPRHGSMWGTGWKSWSLREGGANPPNRKLTTPARPRRAPRCFETQGCANGQAAFVGEKP